MATQSKPAKATRTWNKTKEQIAWEKLRKRRATLVRKVAAFARDCDVHAYLLIEDDSGDWYRFKTNNDPTWPPNDANPVDLDKPDDDLNLEKLPRHEDIGNIPTIDLEEVANSSQLDPPVLLRSPVAERIGQDDG